jgi:hypothetical protein
MPSFFKTQGLRILVSLLSLVLAIIYLVAGDGFNGIYWLLSSVVWMSLANTGYNEECIKVLLKRIEQLENRAITDIDEISRNNFMVRRRLGPDKEDK